MLIHDLGHSLPLVQSCRAHLGHTSSTEIFNGRSYGVALLAEVFEVELKLEISSNLLVLVLTNVFRTQLHLSKFHAVVRRNKSRVELTAEHQVGGESLVIELQFNVSV